MNNTIWWLIWCCGMIFIALLYLCGVGFLVAPHFTLYLLFKIHQRALVFWGRSGPEMQKIWEETRTWPPTTWRRLQWMGWIVLLASTAVAFIWIRSARF
jgi:hypothetical protein